jgi:hypothetical protein
MLRNAGRQANFGLFATRIPTCIEADSDKQQAPLLCPGRIQILLIVRLTEGTVQQRLL